MQNNQEIAELPEDVKMENVYMTHSLFIQNQLKYTSHTVEWLPINHADPDNSKLDVHYFILGTHKEQDDQSFENPKAQLGSDKL